DTQKSPLYQACARGLSIAEALDIPPERLEAVNCLALELVKAGDYPGARAIYLILSQIQPMDERFAFGMATTFQLEGNFAGAAKLYQYYLTFAPDCPLVRLRIGECLFGAREYETAADLFASGADLAAEQGKPELVQYARDMIQRCRPLVPGSIIQ